MGKGCKLVLSGYITGVYLELLRKRSCLLFWVVKGASCKPGSYHVVSRRLKLVQRRAEPRGGERKETSLNCGTPRLQPCWEPQDRPFCRSRFVLGFSPWQLKQLSLPPTGASCLLCLFKCNPSSEAQCLLEVMPPFLSSHSTYCLCRPPVTSIRKVTFANAFPVSLQFCGLVPCFTLW